jgi:antitoxin HicB
MAVQQEPLSHYLDMTYPFTVVPDNGAYFIEFPDLPNCFTQVEDASEIVAMAEEIRTLWIESEYERGNSIPEPAMQSGFSGKFITRVPKTLHKELVAAARQENMSLNAYVGYLLAERNVAAKLNVRMDGLEIQLSVLNERLPYNVDVEKRSVSASQRITKRDMSNLKLVQTKALAA